MEVVVAKPLSGTYTKEQRAEPRTQKELRKLFRSYTEAAAITLAYLAGSEDTPAAVRVMACKVILDRGWGAAPPGLAQNVADEDEGGPKPTAALSEQDLATMDDASLAQVLMEEVGRR